MPDQTASRRRLFRHVPACLLALLPLLLLACSPDQYPQTTLSPRADFARESDSILRLTLIAATVVFVLVEGALLLAMWKFRNRPGAAEPVQTHGNTTLEIVWTIIPAFILAMIAVPTVRTIFKTSVKPGADALQVEVIGHQWWWEFKYPQLGITTAGELRIPVGRTVNLEMTTKDVLHSFWVPAFAGKRDVFPNRFNNLWFTAEVTGDFPAQCVEFCGIQHARMAYRIISMDAAEFDSWAANFNNPPPTFANDSSPEMSQVRAGEAIFKGKGACAGCHSMYPALPLTGPNLHHIGSRGYIAAGTLHNTDENLAKWIKNPQAWKQGSLMVVPPLTDEEIASVVAYLRANK
ncbi:MAG TPA: cytochrome c oxidase subunit II [Gemmatimonadales bacterium]|nr:cytochrome c oxidase subunit II [Gemmatimonadales bacterium]